MQFDNSQKSTSPLSAFDYVVKITDPLTGKDVQLEMGVDRVTGLNTSLGVVKHRKSGLDGSMVKYPGIVDTGTVTMEGLYLASLNDVLVLKDWFDQCAGKKLTAFPGGYRRQVVITHRVRASYSPSADLATVSKSFTLNDVIVKSLKIGDLDSYTESFANWSIEVEYTDLSVG